jgi:DNA-binding NarL/FixJ family response regulator
VWIEDEHPIFRQGLAACVGAEGFTVSGLSAGLVPEPPAGAMDVLLFGVVASTFPRILARTKGTAVRLIALVTSDIDALLYDAVAAGVAAVLVRRDLSEATLAGALRAVAAGQTWSPSEVVSGLLDRAAHSNAGAARGLTARELSVLRRLSEGDDTREIAELLGYAERTVKNIVHDLLVKMNCRNRVHAIATATRRGLI